MLKNRILYLFILLCTTAFFICFNGYYSWYVFLLSLVRFGAWVEYGQSGVTVKIKLGPFRFTGGRGQGKKVRRRTHTGCRREPLAPALGED